MQNDKQILEKMLLYAQRVADYTKGMDYDSFEKNDMAVDACVQSEPAWRNIESDIRRS